MHDAALAKFMTHILETAPVICFGHLVVSLYVNFVGEVTFILSIISFLLYQVQSWSAITCQVKSLVKN